MKTLSIPLLIAIFSLTLFNSNGQVDESQLGGWYMYFFNTSHEKSKIGFQGDVQYRNWNIAGDLEQLLLRGGVTFKPEKANIKFTLGYGNIQLEPLEKRVQQQTKAGFIKKHYSQLKLENDSI